MPETAKGMEKRIEELAERFERNLCV